MRYPDDQQVHIGDVVTFDDDRGVVVGSVDSGKFLPPYDLEDWSELGTGILVRTEEGDLAHFEDETVLADLGFVLERRADEA